ncbi:MAG: pyruvate, water dikinase regulatory protein, partial [Alphaproteobacteria bacterium]
EEGCRKVGVPYISVLDPILHAMTGYLGAEMRGQPGRQHTMDAEYFSRIDAMHFALLHDDGQGLGSLNESDVVLVGVSRTSKTPTCIYIANRGIKAANIPIVAGMAPPPELDKLTKPLVIGLTKSPERLLQVRRHRLLSLQQKDETDYVDPERVKAEVQAARRLFSERKWPSIDVSRRSIEEIAAAILKLYSRHTGIDEQKLRIA